MKDYRAGNQNIPKQNVQIKKSSNFATSQCEHLNHLWKVTSQREFVRLPSNLDSSYNMTYQHQKHVCHFFFIFWNIFLSESDFFYAHSIFFSLFRKCSVTFRRNWISWLQNADMFFSALDLETKSTALWFGVRTLKKTQTPWRKYNVKHPNVPLEILGRFTLKDRLKHFKWPTLKERKLFSSRIECYKIINRLNGLDPSALFSFAHAGFSALKSQSPF